MAGGPINDDLRSHASITVSGIEDARRRTAPIADVRRLPEPAQPPVEGAQWDEVHGRWERWDEATRSWVVVGDDGDGVAPADENPLPPQLARALAGEPDPADAGPGVAPEPSAGPSGAQWDEVRGTWVRWDAVAGAWVDVSAG
jgi:hypothetical protein